MGKQRKDWQVDDLCNFSGTDYADAQSLLFLSHCNLKPPKKSWRTSCILYQ